MLNVTDGNHSLSTTVRNSVSKGSPVLLPGWPNCSTSPDRLPDGAYAVANDWISTGLPPVIIVFGIFGNLLTIIVLNRSSKKLSSTALYLVCLAISDTLFLLNGPLRQWIRHTWEYDIRGAHEVVCKITVWLTYGTLQFSSWSLVALTVERVVSVLWPHKVRTSCTTSLSKVVVIVQFVSIFGLNIHWFYGLGTSSLKYYAVKTCMPLYEDYSYFFHHIWHWINFVVAFALPFIILVIGNGIIISKLKTSVEKRTQMSVMKTKGRAMKAEKEKKTLTIVLILLNAVFFLSQTPMSIYYIYIPYGIAKANELACDNYPEYKNQAEIIWMCYSIVNILGYMNATLNFVLYIISGSRFRAEILALFRCQESRSAGVFESSATVRNGRNGSCLEKTAVATISKTEQVDNI